jgi:hypothetical protein
MAVAVNKMHRSPFAPVPHGQAPTQHASLMPNHSCCSFRGASIMPHLWFRQAAVARSQEPRGTASWVQGNTSKVQICICLLQSTPGW